MCTLHLKLYYNERGEVRKLGGRGGGGAGLVNYCMQFSRSIVCSEYDVIDGIVRAHEITFLLVSFAVSCYWLQ